MKRIFNLLTVLIISVLSVVVLTAYAGNQNPTNNNDRKKVIVEIDYGDLRPSRTVETFWENGRTILEVLQRVAEVKTHPVNQYVFVVSIDGVEGKRKEMAWYYTVNGESAKKLAFSNPVSDQDRIKWIYKKDVCSEKVDK
ncbi:MAG: DUF4430 domain-containing protein [bacterium]